MRKEVISKALKQLKIIEGQVRGLQKMVEEEKYCVDILTQASAVRNSIGSVEDSILKNHLSTCVVEQIKGKQKEKAIEEILVVFKLAKRK